MQQESQWRQIFMLNIIYLISSLLMLTSTILITGDYVCLFLANCLIFEFCWNNAIHLSLFLLVSDLLETKPSFGVHSNGACENDIVAMLMMCFLTFRKTFKKVFAHLLSATRLYYGKYGSTLIWAKYILRKKDWLCYLMSTLPIVVQCKIGKWLWLYHCILLHNVHQVESPSYLGVLSSPLCKKDQFLRWQ